MTMPRAVLLLPLAVWAAACTAEDPSKDDGNVGETVTSDPGDSGETGETDEEPVPASLEVSVDSYVGDIGQTFVVSVRVLDAEGTELPGVDTDLLVADPETAEFTGPQVTFLTEGIFVVTATLGDGSMPTDSDPIRIDDNGPQISLTSPAPGTWLDTDIAVVSGTVVDVLAGVDTVTVMGEPVELGDDGSFSVDLPVQPGPTAIEVIATDIDGNSADAFVGVMSGESADPHVAYAGMRVALGADGIAGIAEPLLTELDPDAVEAAIKSANPVASGSVSCVDYSADVRSVSYGTPVLSVFTETDNVHMDIELSDLEVLVDVDFDLCGFSSGSDTITITDTLTTISADVSIGYIPAFGGLFAQVTDSGVTYTDLQVDYGTIDSLLGAFGLSVSDLGFDAGAIIEDAIVEVVNDEVPPPIVAALDAMEFTEELDVLGSPITLSTNATDVVITEDGVEVELATSTTGPAADPEMPELPGVLSLGGASPDVDPATELALSLSLQELNRILHLAHASGAFRIQLSDSDLGLDPALIDFVFPGATTLDLSFEPTLPPVLTPSASGDHLDMTMLSLTLEARGLVDDVDTELVSGHVHVLGTVEATIDENDDIALEVTSITPVVDTTTPEAGGVAAAEALEDQLASISEGIIGDLFPTITFGIPEIEGMPLTGTGAGTAGELNTWLKVDAEIGE